MASGLITTYLGEGAAASRPATPNISTGAIALWYSTDTAVWSVYANSAWRNTYVAGGTDVALADGGTGASLVDPNADRILFWDDSAGQVTWLSLDPGLEISGTTLRTARGTSFPGSPASGDLFRRTDRGYEYEYDGTQWLTTQRFPLQFGWANAAASDTSPYAAVPYLGTYSIYLERFDVTTLRTAAGEWDMLLQRVSAGGVATTIATIDGSANVTSTWTPQSAAIGSVLDASAVMLMALYDEVSGTATLHGSATLIFRLVG